MVRILQIALGDPFSKSLKKEIYISEAKMSNSFKFSKDIPFLLWKM